ncbi:MAG: GTP cyclohydrolase MptA [Candidatus Kariarchaeaceae archaeon]
MPKPLSKILSDIQAKDAEIPLYINRVGITGLKKAVTREREDVPTHLSAKFEVYVDLPASQKGIHMSRNLEALNAVIDRAVETDTSDTEVMCGLIAQDLLKRQPTATEACVKLVADYFLKKITPQSNKEISAHYVLKARARAVRKSDDTTDTWKTVGIKATGITVCPCSVELTRDYSEEKLHDLGYTSEQIKEILDVVPLASHNQRSESYLSVTLPFDHPSIEANDLVKILESSMSGEVYDLLKRPDEQYVVIKAHESPRFVEDVIRRVLVLFYKRYKSELPPDTQIWVSQTNFESIHSYDAYAQQATTLRKLTKEMELNGA